MNVSFYVKAGPKTGMGHIVRCLALADKLRALGAECRFFAHGLAAEMATVAGYGLRQFLEWDEIWIVDLKQCPLNLAQEVRGKSGTFVILDDDNCHESNLMTDIVIYPGVTGRPYQYDWSGFQGEWHEGADYVLIRDGIRRRWREQHHDPFPRVIVVGGGADIGGVSRRVVGTLDCHYYDVHVVVGAASPDDEPWPDEVQVVVRPDDIFKEFDWADVAVVSYGMTAFECLASGLPTVALSITPDHLASADLVQVESRFALFSVGEVGGATDMDIQDAVELALMSVQEMSGKALEFVDGQGAARVAHRIMEVANG